jgi:CBS domain-containing protein
MARDRIERSLMEDPVADLRPRLPVVATPTTTVGDAVRTMLTQNLGALLVVDHDGILLGIFSERDLLTKVIGLQESYDELPIAQFMTAHPETVTSDDTLAFAIHKMDIGGYRHLPVVAGGRPLGVISVRDMLRHITRLCHDN